MGNVIQTNELTKSFRGKAAVDRLALEVPEGSIYAYLGPNGAGKTTTIKLLMNILFPTSGSAEVLGVPSSQIGVEQFQQIGYVSENQKIPGWMTVPQLVNYCKPMYPTWDDDFCSRLLRQFDLPNDTKLRSMSRGMKVKAMLLSSLAYRPKLLVLDEPFSGLDPLVRDEFIRGILELTESEGWTVFVSSHDIDEVERLADWVGFIDKGALQLSEKRVTLQERFRQIEVVLPDGAEVPKQLPKEWLVPERAGHAFRYVESRFDGQAEERFRSMFPSVETYDPQSLSLRETYLALARHFKGGAQ
ncbi:ABC transporter ATP-binding protein [Pontiella sulfatireligans]|uniref:ABC transporter ATP-binding protein YtrB n=1 Tax=Pontiella sulfatireligans TaxID=2750658 RepID=A0A6C2UTF7_9BACT|nr:ABC transporter ATP-binding protein [Pontiella sulfatireligans]VGO22524.1 ABC transporter ATP-binding protein YtrB [Pontiella sulfatireligans]